MVFDLRFGDLAAVTGFCLEDLRLVLDLSCGDLKIDFRSYFLRHSLAHFLSSLNASNGQIAVHEAINAFSKRLQPGMNKQQQLPVLGSFNVRVAVFTNA